MARNGSIRRFLGTRINHHNIKYFSIAYILYCINTLKFRKINCTASSTIKFYFEQVPHKPDFFAEIPHPKKPSFLPKVLNTIRTEISTFFHSPNHSLDFTKDSKSFNRSTSPAFSCKTDVMHCPDLFQSFYFGFYLVDYFNIINFLFPTYFC